MTETLTGPLAYSARSDSPSELTPALLAAYAALTPGTPLLPSTDEISTRWPEPFLLKISSAVSIWTSAATRLVSMVALLAHSLPEPSLAPLPMPALTMMRSMPPSSSLSPANTLGTASWSLTSSAATATVMPGYFCVSSALSSSSRSVRRAHSARSRPLAANARAMPAPSPELAPVMRIFCRVIGAAYRVAAQRRVVGLDSGSLAPQVDVRVPEKHRGRLLQQTR